MKPREGLESIVADDSKGKSLSGGIDVGIKAETVTCESTDSCLGF